MYQGFKHALAGSVRFFSYPWRVSMPCAGTWKAFAPVGGGHMTPHQLTTPTVIWMLKFGRWTLIFWRSLVYSFHLHLKPSFATTFLQLQFWTFEFVAIFWRGIYVAQAPPMFPPPQTTQFSVTCLAMCTLSRKFQVNKGENLIIFTQILVWEKVLWVWFKVKWRLQVQFSYMTWTIFQRSHRIWESWIWIDFLWKYHNN